MTYLTSFSDISLDTANHLLRHHTKSKRLLNYNGHNMFVFGTSDAPVFYDAEALVRGLLRHADMFEFPLPPALESYDAPYLDDFMVYERAILIDSAIGESRDVLAQRAGSDEKLADLVARAAQANYTVHNPKALQSIIETLREEETAEARIAGIQAQVDEMQDARPDNLPRLEQMQSYIDLLKAPEGVIQKLPPELFEALVGSGKHSIMRWPFKDMQVGDCFRVSVANAKSAQTAAHVYGGRSGKKFRTRRDAAGILTVVRMK